MSATRQHNLDEEISKILREVAPEYLEDCLELEGERESLDNNKAETREMVSNASLKKEAEKLVFKALSSSSSGEYNDFIKLLICHEGPDATLRQEQSELNIESKIKAAPIKEIITQLETSLSLLSTLSDEKTPGLLEIPITEQDVKEFNAALLSVDPEVKSHADVVLPYFYEIDTGNNADCAFTLALRTTREDFTQTLLDGDDTELESRRKLLFNEIKVAFLESEIEESEKVSEAKEWNRQRNEYFEAKSNIDKIVSQYQYWLSEMQGKYGDTVELIQLLEKEHVDVLIGSLKDKYEKFKVARRNANNYCKGKLAYLTYVSAYSTCMNLKRDSAMLFFKIKNKNIFLWEKTSNGFMRLLGSYRGGLDKSDSCHLLMNGQLKFNLLIGSGKITSETNESDKKCIILNKKIFSEIIRHHEIVYSSMYEYYESYLAKKFYDDQEVKRAVYRRMTSAFSKVFPVTKERFKRSTYCLSSDENIGQLKREISEMTKKFNKACNFQNSLRLEVLLPIAEGEAKLFRRYEERRDAQIKELMAHPEKLPIPFRFESNLEDRLKMLAGLVGHDYIDERTGDCLHLIVMRYGNKKIYEYLLSSDLTDKKLVAHMKNKRGFTLDNVMSVRSGEKEIIFGNENDTLVAKVKYEIFLSEIECNLQKYYDQWQIDRRRIEQLSQSSFFNKIVLWFELSINGKPTEKERETIEAVLRLINDMRLSPSRDFAQQFENLLSGHNTDQKNSRLYKVLAFYLSKINDYEVLCDGKIDSDERRRELDGHVDGVMLPVNSLNPFYKIRKNKPPFRYSDAFLNTSLGLKFARTFHFFYTIGSWSTLLLFYFANRLRNSIEKKTDYLSRIMYPLLTVFCVIGEIPIVGFAILMTTICLPIVAVINSVTERVKEKKEKLAVDTLKKGVPIKTYRIGSDTFTHTSANLAFGVYVSSAKMNPSLNSIEISLKHHEREPISVKLTEENADGIDAIVQTCDKDDVMLDELNKYGFYSGSRKFPFFSSNINNSVALDPGDKPSPGL